MIAQVSLSDLPAAREVLSALPVIASLVMIEGLLSVDNAMGIAAMASTLPKNQQKLALRLGIVGAYVLRGAALALAAWIDGNPWLKQGGAAYLLYLMAHGLSSVDEEVGEEHKPRRRMSLLATVFSIEVMDLTLSLDNVVAAVALDKRLWVVCTGVFIGILALRFVAGYCIKLMERFPILEKTAFLLIGFVGLTLTAELALDRFGIAFGVSSAEKFIGITAIVLLSLAYSETAAGKRLLRPLAHVGAPVLHAIDRAVGALFSLVSWPARRLLAAVTR